MYSPSFIGVMTEANSSVLSLSLGSELLVDNAGSNIAVMSTVRINEDRLLWLGSKGNNFIHAGIVSNNSGTLAKSGSTITLSGSTSVANNDRAVGAGVDQDNQLAVVASWDEQSGGGDGNGIDVWGLRDTGAALVEEDSLNFIAAGGGGSGASVGGVDVAFMGVNSGYSYYAIATVVSESGGTRRLKLFTIRYNISTNTIQLRADIVLDSNLSGSEAATYLIGVRVAARADFDVLVVLQGGNWHRATYSSGSNTWSDQGESSSLNGTAQGAITSAKESILNTYKSCVVLQGLSTSSPMSIEIEFLNTSVVGENKIVTTNAFWLDDAHYGEAHRGLMPNDTDECVAVVWRDNTNSDLHFSLYDLSGESNFGLISLDVSKTGVTVVTPYVAQFNSSQWGIFYRDGNRSGHVYCQLIHVNQ